MHVEEPSGQRALRPRARLLRTLGSDLISSERVALIELVKNSYDADASVVLIRFCDSVVDPWGRIEIWDDGHGMSLGTLQHSWLDIASDHKRKTPRSENGRRRVLGEKGIGRLAAARLGNEMLLTTKRGDSDEVQLLIDWTEFDRENAYLDEVEVAWEVGSSSWFTGTGRSSEAFESAQVDLWQRNQGTSIQIERLTKEWSTEDYLELRTALARLVRTNPADSVGSIGSDEFRIVLQLPEEHAALSGQVDSPEELDTPHYRLSGVVNETGSAELRFRQLDPEVDVVLNGFALWNGVDRAPEAGPFSFDIEVWDRDAEAVKKVARAASLRGFRQLLDQVAGVSVYRDGFRVLPFGETGDDWLGLDRRRVQNPTLRVSNNQVIGRVYIGADANAELRDQSNREGLLEGRAYEDLQTMLRQALGVVESRRYSARRGSRLGPANGRGGMFVKFELGELKSAMAENHPSDIKLIEMMDAKSKEIQEGVEEIQQALSQYSRLATLGSLIDRVLHDGRTSVTRLESIVRFGRRDFAKTTLDCGEKLEIASSAWEQTAMQAALLARLFNQIEPFGGRRRGRPKNVAVSSIVSSVTGMFEAEAEELGVKITVECGDIEVRVDDAELQVALVNLVQNAMHWLGTVPREDGRELLIRVSKRLDSSVSILVSDTGPGVPEDLRDSIFDAYFSNRAEGVGLGLSIAGNIIQDLYGGSLRLLETGPLSGATFEANLRKRV